MRYLLIIIIFFILASSAIAQHSVAGRTQWQPTLPNAPQDARLDKRLTLDIVGQTTISALVTLSKQTGVSLAIAPEDLKTVGERKLTVFARDLSLRGLMIQIPVALQECHWDIVVNDGKTSYLLHRNTGAEKTIALLSERERRRREIGDRASREARIADLRRALAMSPQQLAELQKTDSTLARSVQYPEARTYVQALLSLPGDKMEQFLDTGRVQVEYATLPAEVREGISNPMRKGYEEVVKRGTDAHILAALKGNVDSLPSSSLVFGDDRELPSYSPTDPAFVYRIVGTKTDSRGLISTYSLGGGLVQRRGEDAHSAEKRRSKEWIRPVDAGLDRKTVLRAPGLTIQSDGTPSDVARDGTVETAGPTMLLADVQKLLAETTGMSVISDSFFDGGSHALPKDALTGAPLWRILYELGELWDIKWQQAGSCLVFHHTRWFDINGSRSAFGDRLMGDHFGQ